MRDAFVSGEALKGGSATGGLVGDHATHDLPQHASGSAVVNGTLLGVGVGALAQPVLLAELVAVERTSDADLLSADTHLWTCERRVSFVFVYFGVCFVILCCGL